MYMFNHIKTGFLGESVSLGLTPGVYSFICKPRVIKFVTTVKNG